MTPSPRTSPSNTKPRGFLVRSLRRLFILAVSLAAIGTALGVGTFLYFDRGLPSVEALRTYRPPQVTKVYCGDGSLCAEFYRQRRTLISIESLPPHVKNAFLAAEDADFYRNEGLDYFGMLRATGNSTCLRTCSPMPTQYT